MASMRMLEQRRKAGKEITAPAKTNTTCWPAARQAPEQHGQAVRRARRHALQDLAPHLLDKLVKTKIASAPVDRLPCYR
jgi:hypothetical protein